MSMFYDIHAVITGQVSVGDRNKDKLKAELEYICAKYDVELDFWFS